MITFDAQIFSANGLESTHSLLAQVQKDDSEENHLTSRIKRIKKSHMANEKEKLSLTPRLQLNKVVTSLNIY